MAGTLTEAGAVARAVGRSLAYRALAAAFRYPGPGHIAALRGSLELTRAVSELPAALVAALADLDAALDGASEAQLGAEHVAAFGHVMLSDCPLHETAAGAGDPFRQPQALADLAGFYRAFGVEVAGGERGDHLAVELEFMHYLAYREAYALTCHGPDAVALVRRAERRFLDEHLGAFALTVARAIAGRTDGALATAGRALEQLVRCEAAELDLALAGAKPREAAR